MKLLDFLNYKKECPFCHHDLDSYLLNDPLHHLNDSIVCYFSLKNKNFTIDHEITLSLSLTDNSFFVDFGISPVKRIVSLSALDKVKKYIIHNSEYFQSFVFIKKCSNNNCKNYSVKLTLSSFNFDLSTYKLSNYLIEDYSFKKEYDTYTKIVSIHNIINTIDKNESNTNLSAYHYEKFKNGESYTTLINPTLLPYIPFVSPKETSERVYNLIPFI